MLWCFLQSVMTFYVLRSPPTDLCTCLGLIEQSLMFTIYWFKYLPHLTMNVITWMWFSCSLHVFILTWLTIFLNGLVVWQDLLSPSGKVTSYHGKITSYHGGQCHQVYYFVKFYHSSGRHSSCRVGHLLWNFHKFRGAGLELPEWWA